MYISQFSVQNHAAAKRVGRGPRCNEATATRDNGDDDGGRGVMQRLSVSGNSL